MVDIVTVPDPITGGAGAAVTTTQVINAMWNNAKTLSTAGDLYVKQAVAQVGVAPQLDFVVLDKSYLPPVPPAFPSMDPNNGQAIFDAEFIKMTSLITTGMAQYISLYLPHPEFYDRALAWCDRAINEGGTGINPDVESALWERGRARVLTDSARAEDEAMATWANRGFPMPPGALTGQIMDIRLDAGRKLAEVNRDIAIKSFEAELENVRMAVKTVIDSYNDAMNRAIEYVRVLMQAPTVAMQLATGLVGIQNDYIRSLVGYYSAQVTALEPTVRLAITDAQLKLDAERANLNAQVATTDSKTKAALAGAQMFATQSAAGINAIHASTSISGQDSTSI